MLLLVGVLTAVWDLLWDHWLSSVRTSLGWVILIRGIDLLLVGLLLLLLLEALMSAAAHAAAIFIPERGGRGAKKKKETIGRTGGR